MEITVNQLTKTYGAQRAVDEISFQVRAGEIVGFLGPNGAGKTTTMKILTGYMTPSSGTVRIGGIDALAEPHRIKPLIGYLPEHNPLYLDMPVLEYLRYAAELQGVPVQELPARLRRVVVRCGLDEEKHKQIGELSKGYRQRVGLAQALIHDPQVLILDEPTTGLDPNQIAEIRNLIREIGRERTVIFSTHILQEVEAVCDRVLIISKGKIVADGTPQDLGRQSQRRAECAVQIQAPPQAPVQAALAALPMAMEVSPAEGDGRFLVSGSADLELREAIFRLCVEQGWVLTELTPIAERLEDIFRALTQSAAQV
ncbi:MAG: ATP-binding cassette domain-containing protein [Bacteroidia bacterium]|nr:ATP-binding cassette domain-containing protein [Bacteroidia bacterium]